MSFTYTFLASDDFILRFLLEVNTEIGTLYIFFRTKKINIKLKNVSTASKKLRRMRKNKDNNFTVQEYFHDNYMLCIK